MTTRGRAPDIDDGGHRSGRWCCASRSSLTSIPSTLRPPPASRIVLACLESRHPFLSPSDLH